VTPKQPIPPIELVQGTHIVISGVFDAGVYYVEAPQDHRPVFIMPWKGNTLIGTTERTVTGAPEEFLPAEEEIDYLLETLQRYFPHRTPQRDQIVERFAGTRVLPANGGNHSAKRRETTFAIDNPTRPRILTIFGGKLTAYRATAEKVLNSISPSLGVREGGVDTHSIRLFIDKTDFEVVN
jgi:glycerol-3-phosphate dehydrogenase